MVPQPRSSVRRHQKIKASYKSKPKGFQQELRNPKEVVLEEAVWSRGLSDDIFCTILACLPLSSFCRLRCVCKKWSRIGQDLIFINAYTRVSSQVPCLFLGSWDGTSWIYEHSLNSWKCISRSFFCPKGLEGKWSPVGAVGSRLLLTNNSKCLYDRDYSFKVYNPLSGTQETLPPLLPEAQHERRYGFLDTKSEVGIIGMPEGSEENYYRILVMDRKTSILDDPHDYDDEEFEYSTLHAQVYDCKVSKWDLKDMSDATSDIELLNVALFGDALQHLISLDHRRFRDYRTMGDLMIVRVSGTHDDFGAYDWDLEGKPDLDVPEDDMELKIVTAHIFVSRGRLMLAAAVPLLTSANRIWKCKSIIIWGLLKVSDKWVRTAEIDFRKLDPHLFQVPLDSFFFLSFGDYLYFGSNAAEFVGIINVPEKTWCVLPPCPSFAPRRGMPARSKTKLLTFIYQPGFDLVA